MPTTSDKQPPLRRALLIVGTLTFVVAALGVNARATYGTQVTADEPQYLMTAISLADDFDLDIDDEIIARQYLPFHEKGLNPQTTPLTGAGQRVSPHDPLLPALLAVPMKLGGWRLAKLFLAAMAGILASLTLWVAVRRFAVDHRIGSLVVGALFVTPPLTSYGTQVYPEIPAALAVMTCVAVITGSQRARSLMVGGTALIALPWLSVKYAPVATVLGILMLFRLVGQRRRLTTLVWMSSLAAMGAIYLAFHQRVYGGWTVFAAGDHFVGGEFEVVGQQPDYPARTGRLYGLLVDRGFGLAAWSPAYLVAVPALASLARLRPRGWHLLVLPVGTAWAGATWVAFTMHGWWWPGRQVVVVIPLVVIVIALLIDRHQQVLRPLLAASAIGFASWIWLVVESTTGRRTLIFDFEQTSNPWYQAWSALLPDLRRWPAGTTALSVVWVVTLAASGWLGWKMARPCSDHKTAGDAKPPVCGGHLQPMSPAAIREDR